MSEIVFGEPYYKHVIRENGYDPGLFEGFNADLQSIGREELEQIFLCHKGLYDFRDAGGEKAVLTGFGLSGVPHLGTLSQINRIGLLNRAGYDAEVILGDLDAYNGKLVPLPDARQLADTYREFIRSTELLDPDTSRVRDQFSHPEVLRTAYVLGRYVTDKLFDDAEEDLHGFYSDRGKVDESMTYRRKLSLNLMIADFFHLGQDKPDVLVMLGVDEHQYVRTAQTISDHLDSGASGISPVRIHSLYTPLIKGLNGFPKMSKSFPESGISLDMEENDIRDAILGEDDSFVAAEDSVLYQIASGIGLEEGTKLREVKKAAEAKGSEWQQMKRILIGRIATFASQWKEAAS